MTVALFARETFIFQKETIVPKPRSHTAESTLIVTHETSRPTETTPLLPQKTKTTSQSTVTTETNNMLETRHHLLPIILAIFLPITFIITYSMAVAYDHVEPGFPYISDTGTFPPESCVFGQLLNIGAVISGIIIYIRYRHIHLLFENDPERRGLLRLNSVAFWVGMVTNLGVSIVGNFQESNVIVVHLIGATMAFFVGFIYCVLQTVISYKTAGTSQMMGNTPTMRVVRVVLCVLNAIFIVMVGSSTFIAARAGPGPGKTRYKWTADDPMAVSAASTSAGKESDGVKSYKWTSADPGYAEHLVATISEWLVAFCIVTYFATFYHEFKHFRVTPPRIVHYKQTQGQTIKTEEQSNNGVSVIST